MFLLVPAHPGCPGQNPKSLRTVVCVCVCVRACVHAFRACMRDHSELLYSASYICQCMQSIYTVSQKNVLTLKRYSSKLQGAILMKFGRNIQNTLE